MKNRNYKPYLCIILLFGFWACSSKPEPNLKLSNPEAFAFAIEDIWEVNATVIAKDFTQKKTDDVFIAKLSYTVDIVTVESDTLKSIFDDWSEEENSEEFIDMALEAQLELDTTFGEGSYKLIFHVKDEFSNQTKSIEVKFDLTK